MKKYLLLLFALAMVLSLAACEKDPTTVPTAATQPTAPTTVPTTAPTVPTTVPTAPAHVHIVSQWQVDMDNHWQQCMDCGEILNKNPHGLYTGPCRDCNAEVFPSLLGDGCSVFVYDANGNEILCQEYDVNDVLLCVTAWEYTYDAAGNMQTAIEYVDGQLFSETTYQLDADGLPSIATMTTYYEDGSKDHVEYDQWSNLSLWIVYDADGQIVSHQRNENTYDDEGNILYQKSYENDVLTSETEYTVVEHAYGSYAYPVKDTQYHEDGTRTITVYGEEYEVIEVLYVDADGNPVDHSSKFDPEVCAPLFGTWEGELLIDGEMMGLGDTAGLEGLEDLRVKMTFRSTFYTDGRARMEMLVDMESMRTFVLEVTYATLIADMGLTREEANAEFEAEMGMTIEAYVDLMLGSSELAAMQHMEQEMVYYVEGDQIYAGESWNSYMTPEQFTLEGDTLTLTSASLVGDAPLEAVLTKTGDLVDNSGNFDAEVCAPLFGTWSGDVILNGASQGLPIDVRCRLTLTFTEDGQLQCAMVLNREDVKAATIEQLYQTFEAAGMTREDVDTLFMENSGTTIGEAVDAMLDSGASEVQLEQSYTGVYFVADGMIYGGANWEGTMEPTAYILEGDTLTLTSEAETAYILTRTEN